MTALLTDVAQAVTDELNAATWSQPFNATLRYLPSYTLEQAETQRVDVVQVGSTQERLTRGSTSTLCEIDIGVMKRVERDDDGNADPSACDASVALVDEIVRYFFQRELEDVVGSFCNAVRPEPLYDAGMLKTEAVFLAVIRLTVTVYP